MLGVLFAAQDCFLDYNFKIAKNIPLFINKCTKDSSTSESSQECSNFQSLSKFHYRFHCSPPVILVLEVFSTTRSNTQVLSSTYSTFKENDKLMICKHYNLLILCLKNYEAL